MLKLFTLLLGCIVFFGPIGKTYATELIISGNGTSADSEVVLNTTTTANITQTNDAQISSYVDTQAITGDNGVSANTGSDSSITTGDISTDTSISNTVNLSEVNSNCCPSASGVNLTITGNGVDSTNTIEADINNQTTVTVDQVANIQNNIINNASTGENSAENNNGNVLISTGNIKIDAQISNQFINVSEISAPQLNTDLSVKISDNGANSENRVRVNLASLSFLSITNLSDIQNSIVNNASTGGNLADNNLGDVAIITGDIWIGTNIENGPINVGLIKIPCCFAGGIDDPADPSDPGNGGTGGDTGNTSSPPDSSLPSSSAASSSSSSSSSSGGEVLGVALAQAGQILPSTGSNLIFMLTLVSLLMFLLGLYLRYHPGCDPGFRWSI